jgi:O-acetyl-ADP-ribose deacetylase (regulator of RNase III)
MTLETDHGDLIAADVDALVNPVNTDGVMGKGLALQFKKAFPDVFADYARACKDGKVEIGRVHVVQRSTPPLFVINFPTKKHWRQPSKLEYIESGLADLVAQIRRLKIRSIAVPPLGCGLGGLDWRDVKPRIAGALGSLPDVRVVLFEPERPA